ncbi:MAG: phage major capsid protein, partial [bacterium]
MPPSLNRTYDAVLSSCLDAYLGDSPFDNIFRDSVFLSTAQAKGCLEAQSGGYQLRVPITTTVSGTVGSYTNYDQIDTTPQDEFTTAFYSWKQLAGSVSISGIEEAQNEGEAAIFDLLRGKTEVCLSSLREEFNLQLLGKTVSSGIWSAGTNSLSSSTTSDIDPIPAMLAQDPTDSATIGNINKSTYAWWRAKCADFATDTASTNHADVANQVTTYAEVLRYLNSLYYECSKGGGGRPDFIITSKNGFELVEAALRSSVRYTTT